MSFDTDTYRTPRYLFNWLNKRFKFEIDGCATPANALCDMYITQADDFTNPIRKLRSQSSIWVNPPYSNPLPFVERAAQLKTEGHLVVMLLPADKSTKWYQVIQANATEVIDIIGGRISFIHPQTGEETKGNSKGSMVAVFDPFMQGLVTRQVSLDFIRAVGS